MNLKKTALCAAALLGLGLRAQPAKATDFGVFGAYQDTQDAGHGYGGGVKLDFARFITLRATYLGDITSGTRFTNSSDLKLRVLPLEAGLQYKFQPDANFSPYLGGGASYFILNPNHGDTNNELGWFAVAGADIKTQHSFGVTLEAIYRSVDATVRENVPSGTTTISEKVPLQLRGFGANAGLVWHF
jgi:opacity protein-like surface antigen